MKNLNSSKILYISLDGIMEPLGFSQVYKYLEKLSKNYKINLITLEKASDLKRYDALEILEKKCCANQIHWHRLKYRSGWWGMGQLFNIINLIITPFYLLTKHKISIIHIRSYMPGLAIPILSVFFRFKFIFDIRGFWADEKADRLNWNRASFKYKFFKALENFLMKRADYIVTLTQDSKGIIAKNFSKDLSLIEVIPTCVDYEEFQSSIPTSKKKSSMRIGYLGSIDTAYDFQKFSNLIVQIQQHYHGKLELKVFTTNTFEKVQNILLGKKIENIDLDVRFLERSEIPSEISKCSFVGFYLKENFSVSASMPTKIAETLACGVPIVCNSFNTDIANLIESNQVGLIYNFKDPFLPTDFNELKYLLRDLDASTRCSNLAKTHFSLERGTSKYKKIYSTLLQH